MADYQIRVVIKEDVPGHGEFNDCLYYSPADFAKMTEDQIQADKQARVDGWVRFMESQREIQSDPRVIAEREAEEVAARKQAMKAAVLADTPEMNALLDTAIQVVSEGVDSRDQLKEVLVATLGDK